MKNSDPAPPGLEGLDREPEPLDGLPVLVTGGSMGIGRACAEEILRAGGRVLVAARSGDALETAARALGEAFGEDRVASLTGDVSRPDDVRAMVAGVVDRFGSVGGIVHAAGVVGPIGPAMDVEAADWLDTVRVNLFGSFLVAREGARAMRRAGQGRIVLFSGGGATSPFPNYSAYAASKAAVVRLAETLAEELRDVGVTVNALAPGFVATRMQDQTLAAGERAGADYLERTRRQLEEGAIPARLAALTAVFLLSRRARGITGRLVAAPWDRWWAWPEHGAALEGSDLFTLRRIVPRDRGEDWQ